MALTALTRRYSFRGVHSLTTGVHREKLHGHQYYLEVSFRGLPEEEVSRLVETEVIAQLDGRDLTAQIFPATGEKIVEWIDERLRASPIGTQILAVCLQETRKNRFISRRSHVWFI